MAKTGTWIIEHLPPHMTEEQLEAQRNLNYQRARRFYQLRFDKFKEYIKQKLSLEEENILENLNKQIEEIWNKNIVQLVYSELDNYINSGTFSDRLLSDENLDYEIMFARNIIAEIIQTPNWRTNKRVIGAVFGNNFEIFVLGILRSFAREIASVTDDEINNELWALISATGKVTSKSQSVGSKGGGYDILNIRPDIIIGAKNSDIKKSSGIAKINGVPIELQGWIELTENEDQIYGIIDALANEYNNAGFFGLSLKVWEESNSKEFTSSQPLRDSLKQDFMQKDSKGSRHAWEKDYIANYMLWKISNVIINIIGPTNVGIVTGKGFDSFDHWLSEHIFYMKVQVKNIRKKRNAQLGLPDINDTGIYIRDFNFGTQKLISSIRKTKVGGSLSISAIKKKV